MSPGKRRWTLFRQLIGSLVPLIFVAPPIGLGVQEVVAHGPSLKVLMWVGVTIVVGWFAVCLFGQVGSGGVRKAMAIRLQNERPGDPFPKWFVGFARPTHKSLIDHHEDLGWLILEDELLVVLGSIRRFEIPRRMVTGIKREPNAHSILGLGGWIKIEGEVGGEKIGLRLEPRIKPTLLGNRMKIGPIQREIKSWLQQPEGTLAANEDNSLDLGSPGSSGD
jgi:hypothetical protein